MNTTDQLTVPVSRVKGIILVLTGASLWGISGTVAQYLFQKQGFTPEWLVVIRLLLAGSILLGISAIHDRKKVWGIWRDKQDAIGLIVFGIIGILAVQYTFFSAINESNAAAATILQYLAPVMISIYLAIRMKRRPTAKEITAIFLALFGTFLLVTQGDLGRLSISGIALFWGIISAVALAFYTLHPQKLLEKWGALLITGWGMLIGGISFSFVHPPWAFEGHWSLNSYLALSFVVLFGTIIAFYCYLESLKYISASETSLLASVEPLSSAFLSVVWLKVSFGFEAWIGTLAILSTILLLSVKTKRMKTEAIELKV